MTRRQKFTSFRFLLLAWFVVQPAIADVITSEFDDRDYRSLWLENGLQVLLISDPKTDKAAAALDVHVGSGTDPEDRPGLAHLLEHMLFLGTDSYPEAGEYQAFIQQRGGSDNAYTMPDHTNYYFDIQAEHLEKALERFSGFFVAPLFTAEFVERERAVVDAEFSSKLQSDGRRYLAARRQAFDPRHPESGFAVGDKHTLADRDGDPIREDLIRFYEEHYRARRMSLVVLGQEPLDVLQTWVEACFAGIREGQGVGGQDEISIYTPGTLPLLQKIIPVKEVRQAVFAFAIPSALDHYAAKPLSYLAGLLGHEGPGSVLSLLKEKGWADALSAGGGLSYDQYGTFEVTISLTEAGLENYRQVGELLFDAIRRIRVRGVEAWVFEEQQQLAKLDFRFREKVEAYTLVRALAARMHDYPVQDLYYAPYRYDEFDRDLILEYLERLVPENLHLLLLAPGLDTDQVEENYGVPYSLVSLPSELVVAWSDPPVHWKLYLPKPNPFIASDLALRHEDANIPRPVQIEIEDGFTLWFDNDISYGSPRGSLYISVRSPMTRLTPREAVLTKLYVSIVTDQLNTFAYPARLAGLGFELYDHQRGFTLKISGYTDKQTALLESILVALRFPEVTSERFVRIRDNLVRRLRNFSLERPYGQAISDLRRLLLENAWWPDDMIEAAETATPEELEAFVSRLLEAVESVALAHGNYVREEALSLASLVADQLLEQSQRVVVSHAQVVQLALGEKSVRTLEIDHPDRVLALYLQGSSQKLSERAQFFLVGQLVNAPFYQSLRTVQQMGYIVACGAMEIMRVPGLVFVVQSPDRHPDVIEVAINEFLQSYREVLGTMTESEFEQYRSSLIGEVLRQEQQLRDRSSRYWHEIDHRDYLFDSRERLAAAIGEITLAELRRFFGEFVLAADRPRLVVRSFGAEQGIGPELSANQIVDPIAFRSSRGRFPLPQN